MTRLLAGTAIASLAASAVLATVLPATAADVDLPETFLSTPSEWRYSDNGADPSVGDADYLSWTRADFDDSAWRTASGPFGAKNGAATGLGEAFPVTTLLTQYLDGTRIDVPTFHFRTDLTVSAEQLDELAALQGTVTYDDALRVYVNGEKVAGFLDDRVEAVPDAQKNLTYAGDSKGDPVTSTFTIPVDALQPGENTVAVALYQDRETSSDIYFDLKSLVPVDKDQPVSISDIVLGVGGTERERNLAWYSSADVPQTAQLAKAADVAGGEFPASAVTVDAVGGPTTSGEYSRNATFGGLEENTEYAYRVGSDANGWSDIYTFRTQAFSGDFDFLFFGDPQIGASGNVSNDAAGWADTLDVAQAAVPDAELLFSAGDQVEHAANEDQYEAFLSPEQLRSIPLVATNGNHDVGSKAYEQHYNLPNEDLAAGAGGSSTSGGDYWFIYKDVLFLNINSNSRDDDSHNAFMERVIAEHGDEATWKVLAFHHSIYSVASHTDDGDILDRRSTMPQTISDLGFDLVLMGHDHSYTRSYLIEDGAVADATEMAGQAKVEAEEGEVLYVTANSASGSKYYNVKAPDAEFASVINQERVRNYSVLEVTDASITVRTLRSEANGDGDPVNSVVDEVELTRAGDDDGGDPEPGDGSDPGPGDGSDPEPGEGSDPGAGNGADGDADGEGTDEAPSSTPAAPAASGEDLPDALRGAVDIRVNGREVTVSGLAADEWHHLYVYSDPVSLGWVRADGEGTLTASLPADLSPGTHRLAVLDADGALLGWQEFTVAADGSVTPAGELAATGGEAPAFAATVLLALSMVAGGAYLVLRRRAQRA